MRPQDLCPGHRGVASPGPWGRRLPKNNLPPPDKIRPEAFKIKIKKEKILKIKS